MSGSADKTIKIWDIEKKSNVETLLGHTSSVMSLSVSNDSSFIISGSADKSVMIWEK